MTTARTAPFTWTQDFVQKTSSCACRPLMRNIRSWQHVHAGPACIDVFGEAPFSPVSVKEAWEYSVRHSRSWRLRCQNEAGQITNRYIRGDERSFTIIAYPVPEIGGNYEEIFREIVKINTLDYQLYQKIQQTIIDTLDTCRVGSGKGKRKQ